MSSISKCNPDEYARIAEAILREDLESLMRTFSTEERVELWNELRKSWKKYIIECSPTIPKDVDKIYRGKFRFAQLLLAATFKFLGEGYDDIVKMFKDEEYEILRDFEEYKILDNLSVDDIVEFIRRREGKVYEIVRKYYEKQYNMLDRAWGHLIGDLAYMFNQRYKDRRKKIEEAVIKYVKRFGLLPTISEIEEAVKKVVEASKFRNEVVNEASKKLIQLEELGIEERLEELERRRRELLSRLSDVEERIVKGAEVGTELVSNLENAKNEVVKSHEELEKLVSSVEESLREAINALGGKEKELIEFLRRYKGEASEIVKAEAELLRNSVKELISKVREYESLLNKLRFEKESVEAKLKELEAALRGESEGHLVTSEEVRAFEELLISRLMAKVGKGARIYDPVKGEWRKIDDWDEVIHYNLYGDYPPPNGRALALIKKRGILRRKDIVIEAVTVLHPKTLKENGWDTRPTSLAEILDVLTSKIDEAEKSKYYHLLIISSPTGFTSKAKEYVGSDEFRKSFVSMNVTLYLVDPVTGEVIHHKADKAAIENKELASLELPTERVMKVQKYVLSPEAYSLATRTSPAAPFIRLDQIAKATNELPEIIRRALSELEKLGYGRVLRSKSGAIAFFYKIEKVGGGLK